MISPMRARQIIRILTASALAGVVATATLTQFYGGFIQLSHISLVASHPGLIANYFPDSTTSRFRIVAQTDWRFARLLRVPNFSADDIGASLSLPWWFILLVSTLLTALVWRLTRHLKTSPAFPINESN